MAVRMHTIVAEPGPIPHADIQRLTWAVPLLQVSVVVPGPLVSVIGGDVSASCRVRHVGAVAVPAQH